MDADDRFDSPHDREPRAGSRSIARRLASHWRRILILWLLLATPTAYLIFRFVEPTYEAFSLIQVQPVRPALFGPGNHGSTDWQVAQPYLETQVQLLLSDRVLEAAIARPASKASPMISQLPMIASSKYPMADLRNEMVVELVKNTFLIRIALTSRDPQEAAAIVNAVVDSYLEQHNEYHRTANKTLKLGLEDELVTVATKIEHNKKELRRLIEADHVEIRRLQVKPDAAVKDDGSEIDPSLPTVTEEQYLKATDRLLQADLALIEAQARLETARVGKGAAASKLPELEAAVEDAKRTRIGFTRYLAKLEIRGKVQNNDPVKATLMNRELEGLMRMQDVIAEKLEELRFESKQDVYRVNRHDEAQVPKAPANNPRFAVMAASSVGLLLLTLGFFLIQEIKAGRVGDADGAHSGASA